MFRSLQYQNPARLAYCLTILCLAGCGKPASEVKNTPLEEVAGTKDVLDFMTTFEGLGLLSDSSEAIPASLAIKAFQFPDNLALDLVLSEPTVTQPVFINFDHKGRLWVVHYNQYPYPKGLKVMSMDQYVRAEYDKVPEAPPDGERGADKISFFEDTDGDGTFDKQTDAITGLNITTSVVLGRGKIWVLAPPYLLAYSDKDDNGIPEGTPEVHLRGFGLEDTHAVANNLRWGPDGWLYGAQGSTCTANVSSSVSKNVSFSGQVIWRYHPETHVFEVFAEGGGNTFDVEIDDKGRLYSGDNGNTRGRYYKQGAYFIRRLGKHGAFTNPYAFGYLVDMENTGEKNRFTHAFVRYQERGLPEEYYDRMIAINPLRGYILLTRFEVNGSTFKVIDERRILETTDRWFRPVDIITGPDGALYIADWYDSRLSHVDPRDTWSKTTGRIYRLRDSRDQVTFPSFDISAYSREQLVELLRDQRRWYRQQALIEFGNRRDNSVVPHLRDILVNETGQLALEALWAINLTGAFNDSIAMAGLHHADPFVRLWTARLLGDANDVSQHIANELSVLARKEVHPEVRSQLAATAKRLPASSAIPVIYSLLSGANDADDNDPDIPLQIWWAVESKIGIATEVVVDMFRDKLIWNNKVVASTVLNRLMQRLVVEGGDKNYRACATLLNLAPNQQLAGPLIDGIQEGLRGASITQLSPELVKALQPYQTRYASESIVLAIRQGNAAEIEKALAIVADNKAEIGLRLSYIRVLGEIQESRAVPVLLKLLSGNRASVAVKQAALSALSGFDDAAIGLSVTRAYPEYLRFDLQVREAALFLLAQRKTWAVHLLNAIDRSNATDDGIIPHSIDEADVPFAVASQLMLLNDPEITQRASKLWPDAVPASAAEKVARMETFMSVLKSGRGNEAAGEPIFKARCASCHKLFGEGADIGPDLTGYDRKNVDDMLMNIVDPNAYIREGYAIYHITTNDRRSVTGRLIDQGGSTIVVQLFNGETLTLHKDQVQEMTEQKTSLMPEGLLNGLTDQQVRDLMAYLAGNGR